MLFMIIASIDGHNYWNGINEKLKSIVEIYIKIRGNREYIVSRKKIIKSVFCFRRTVLVITIIICMVNYGEYTNKLIKQYDFSVKQNNKWGESIELMNGKEVIQSFTTDKIFNTIEINFQVFNKKDSNKYKFQLLDEEANIIYEKELNAKEIKNNEYVIFNFNTEIPDGKEVYNIRIRAENNTNEKDIGLSQYSRPYYDVVPTGELFIDGQQVEGDLMFKVYNLSENSYMTQLGYIILSFLIIVGEYILFEIYLRWLKNNESSILR